MTYSYVDNGAGSVQADNWMITPAIEIPDYVTHMTFRATNANASYPETITVCIGSSADPAAMTEVKTVKATTGHDAWELFDIDLSAYAGQTIYVGFHDTCYDMYECWVDLIEFRHTDEAIKPAPVRDWQSVTIDDQIYINFMLAPRDDFTSVTIEYIDQDKQQAAKTIVYDDLDDLTFVDGHYLIPVEIAPAQIGDTIKATLKVGNKTIEYSTSVAEYCKYLLNNDGYTAEQKALAKATLEYGQAANDYFAGTGYAYGVKAKACFTTGA